MKYLSVPDLHADKSWIELTEKLLSKVKEMAMEHSVDFVAFPGDMHNKNFHLGKEYNRFRKAVKSIINVCPVVAITGTPGHEHEAMYGPLEDLGLVLLRPGKVYGFNYADDGPMIHALGQDAGHGSPDAILFGIPELKKDNIQATLNLPAEQANAEAVTQFGNYIDEFVAPMRLKYKNIPAIGIIHGNISDSKKEHSNDIILKSSDIVIHSETLARANLDYWSAGHIHTPCNFKGGSYAGSWSINWGEIDFVPAFELIEITENIEINRIPSGTPMRKKITAPLSDYDPDIAYWLVTEDQNATFPENIHPWSRITYAETVAETRRVTAEEIASVKTLWDLFSLIDPTIEPQLKKKVDLIEETIPPPQVSPRKMRLTYLKIQGSKFFEGRTIEFDFTKLPKSLSLITGENGSGKSGLLGFMSWYPLVIGKKTKNGRISAIKDFFIGQNSSIEKKGYVNNILHEHLITIKGTQTQNPKVECYLTIAGMPQLEKATFDTMFQKCEELYGSYSDYLLTTFYVQPLQGVINSGIMNSSMTETRDLVHHIAGKDREKEKEFALVKKKDLEESGKMLNAKIETLEENLDDKGALENEIDNLQESVEIAQDELTSIERSGNEERENFEIFRGKQKENETAKNNLNIINRDIEAKKKKITINNQLIEEKVESIDNLEKNRATVAKDKKNREQIALLEKDKATYDKENNTKKLEHLGKVTIYTKEVAEYNSDNSNYKYAINNCQTRIAAHVETIKTLNKPCEYCGKLSSDSEEKIYQMNEIIANTNQRITDAGNAIDKLVPPKGPEKPTIKPFLDNDKIEKLKASLEWDIETIQAKIEVALQAEGEIKLLREEIPRLEEDIRKLTERKNIIVVDNNIDNQVSDSERLLEDIRKQYSEKRSSVEEIRHDIDSTTEKISKIDEQSEKINKMKTEFTGIFSDGEDWTYLAKRLSANQIPALELDVELVNIDAEATRNIEPFLEGRYSFRTLTQDMGKKNTVDRFDIMIHDGATGQEDSFFFENPGHKAFFNDSYIKALIRQRNMKSQISYSPVIFDEADSPIKEHRISMYYDINRKYFENKDVSVICISQKDSAVNYMDKVIDIEDLKE